VTAETIARTIMFILAPVVMVNATALILNGVLAYYDGLNDRMRRLAKERLELLRGAADAFTAERLREIDAQLPDMLSRHKLTRDAIFYMSVSIGLYVLTMLLIALAAFGAVWVEALALVLFLVSTVCMLIGIAFKVLEIRSSHRAVELEVQRVSKLTTLQPNT
jgi:hypothetical protein